jgi:alpha-L-fucosidase 2
MTSRRTVLGSALGATTAAALPGVAAAATAPPEASAAGGRWQLRNRMDSDGAWAGFLRGQDLVWHRLPTVWYEGPFLGDGRLGSMVYREPDANSIRFTVQHGEVQDHRPEFGWGYPHALKAVGEAGAPPGCPWGI